MNVRRQLAAAAATAALVGGSLAMAADADAATYPYQNWSRTSGNTAGVVFHPSGDKFEIWDNVRDSSATWVAYNYKGVNDSWKRVGTVVDQHKTVSHNLYESINGKRAYIYFEVCDTVKGCSKASLYRTWGS